MTETRTQATDTAANAFLDTLGPAARRADAVALCDLMARVSGEPPVMWGSSIVGFGRYRYRYDSGREGETCRTGFSPRKTAFTLYLTSGAPLPEAVLARLGKHSTGKGCVYIKSLKDVDMAALEELIAASLAGRQPG